MSKEKVFDVVKVKISGHSQFFIHVEKANRFVPLNESHLSRASPGYTRLNEAARKKEFDTFIKHSNIIRKVKIPAWLPNTVGKPWWKLSPEIQKSSVQALLSIGELFESPKPGYVVLADLLSGMHCQALRKAEPTFCPMVAVQSSSPEILSAFEAVAKSSVRLSKWPLRRRLKIRRKVVLDYRTGWGKFSHHIQDFSQCKCIVPGYKPLRFPISYTDTMALIIGASNSQLKEAAPYIENAAVILLNSDTGDFRPTKLSSGDLAAYDPEVINQLKKEHKRIAALLFWWRRIIGNEDVWARWIVQEAHTSFGKPDSRYVRVELDPKKLRDAVRYRVLLSFFDVLGTGGFMTPEELQPHRQAAKDVFDPAPPEEVLVRHAEDPDVFVEIMKELVSANATSIVAEGKRFVKADKPFAAWRTISDEQYLVMPEDTWAKAYKKAALARKNLETSFLKKDGWEKTMQKRLVEAEVIKGASSGYRYRYDLYGSKTRDQTYVVAVPIQILEN